MWNKNFVVDKKVARLFIVIVIMITQCIIMSHDVVRHLRCRSRRFYCLLLVFITWWGRLITLHHLYYYGQEWCISILIVPGRYSQCSILYRSPDPRSCSPGGPLLYWSSVMLLYREYPRFGMSIPLSLLMLLGWSLMWIASLTLRVYQWGPRSLNFTSLQSSFTKELRSTKKS